MTLPDALDLIFLVSLGLAGGTLLGLVYFTAVGATAGLLVRGGRPWLAVGLTFGRFALLAAGFGLALQAGAPAILAALAGLVAGRSLVLRTGRTAMS